MSSRLDRITLSLSSPTFLAFSSPSLARDACLPVSTWLCVSFTGSATTSVYVCTSASALTAL